ncbi:MAG: copper transporter [Actinomycetota bacterium]
MIDFRYLLVTVVGIFLALTIGIALGAGFLGEPLRKNLQNRIETVEGEVQEQRGQIAQLNDQNDEISAFVQAAEPWTIENRLVGRDVVLFTIEGADGGVIGGTIDTLESAGAAVVTEINLGEKLAIENEPVANELATIVDSVASEKQGVMLDAASALGEEAASLSSNGESLTPDGEPSTQESYGDLLGLLEEKDFISVPRRSDQNDLIPRNASFVIAGGNATPRPFEVPAFVTRLALDLAEGNNHVVVTESSSSQWDMVDSIRNDTDADTLVSTVDVGELSRGHVAVVLSLAGSTSEAPGHYGNSEGTLPLPDPPPE